MTLRAGTRRFSGPLAVVLACVLPVIARGGANSLAENLPEASPADAEVFFPKLVPALHPCPPEIYPVSCSRTVRMYSATQLRYGRHFSAISSNSSAPGVSSRP